MQGYLFATVKDAEGVRIWSICSDGVRVGDPPEETELYFAWAGDLNKGMVWPPEVPIVELKWEVEVSCGSVRILLSSVLTSFGLNFPYVRRQY